MTRQSNWASKCLLLNGKAPFPSSLFRVELRMREENLVRHDAAFTRLLKRRVGKLELGVFMIAGSRSPWNRPVRWFIWCMAMTSFAVLNARGQQAASPPQTATPQQPATGQQTDQLQQQLQQLKQQYDATTHDLEQRISALEQQIEKQKEKEKEEKEART